MCLVNFGGQKFSQKVLGTEKISVEEEKKRKYELRHASFCFIS